VAHPPICEEVLTVLAGCAEVWIGEERADVIAGQSVIVPAGHRHGFHNIGETVLHMEAILAAPLFGPVTQRD
jgi:mannose-6-phosphate isomerase-like protein (cupin superfamily)